LIVILSKLLSRAKDLSEPRAAARFLRRDNRAFGSLPLQTALLPDFFSCPSVFSHRSPALK
jgi:hypothetical protein